ncbi:MAG: SemiSWEET transporter [Alphaproteobacteria bacterium]|nr:SemiSWEET transporter [Alphaproteobacteria bacterium]
MDTVGYVAGVISTFAYLPQVVRTCRTRSARDLSLVTLVSLTTAASLWLLYGIMSAQWPVIFPNAATLVLTVVILGYKVFGDSG